MALVKASSTIFEKGDKRKLVRENISQICEGKMQTA